MARIVSDVCHGRGTSFDVPDGRVNRPGSGGRPPVAVAIPDEAPDRLADLVRQDDGPSLVGGLGEERGLVAGLQLIDCQLPTPHLRSLGSKPMPRSAFSALVAQYARADDVALFSTT